MWMQVFNVHNTLDHLSCCFYILPYIHWLCVWQCVYLLLSIRTLILYPLKRFCCHLTYYEPLVYAIECNSVSNRNNITLDFAIRTAVNSYIFLTYLWRNKLFPHQLSNHEWLIKVFFFFSVNLLLLLLSVHRLFRHY